MRTPRRVSGDVDFYRGGLPRVPECAGELVELEKREEIFLVVCWVSRRGHARGALKLNMHGGLRPGFAFGCNRPVHGVLAFATQPPTRDRPARVTSSSITSRCLQKRCRQRGEFELGRLDGCSRENIMSMEGSTAPTPSSTCHASAT